MSMTLTLNTAGWDSIRRSVACGRRTDALAKLSRLLSRPDLPSAIAADAHRLAGELSLEAERYHEARNRFRAAAALAPACARTFYLWGAAHESDPHGCDRRAAVRFRHAMGLEPENNLYRASFGRAAIRSGRAKPGVRELLTAANAATDDVAVLRVAVDGLLEAGRVKAARRVVLKARFLRPECRAVAVLWERVRFEATRREQRELGRTTRHRQDAEFARDGGRVVLPFVRLVGVGGTGRGSGSTGRCDVVSLPQPHFPRLSVRRADHR